LIVTSVFKLPQFLFRRTSAEFAEAFLNRGALRFMPLTYYWGFDEHWQDAYEGRPCRELQSDTEFEIRDSDTGELLFAFSKGKISRELSRPHYHFIFCTSKNSGTLPPRPESVLIQITEPGEFVRRLQFVTAKRLGCHWLTVR
jgi:hypothetical protein